MALSADNVQAGLFEPLGHEATLRKEMFDGFEVSVVRLKRGGSTFDLLVLEAFKIRV